MIFPYLSLTSPETQSNFILAGNHQMSGSLPDPWVVPAPPWFSPSRLSTEVSLCCEGSSLMCRELSGSYRPVAALAFRLSSRWLLM